MVEVPLRPYPAEAPSGGRKRVTGLSDSEFYPRPQREGRSGQFFTPAGLKSTETNTADRPGSTITEKLPLYSKL
ncbi:hypothetical protein SAMN05444955_10268 [Lihuaxuella thermophila]|uniref:Uncharacterized protein n=1 Tax=Lihuaxuella thermophila TaxID=1173111 RepID=A0A1H8BBX7_9BACL|nr:hypothetical protein SAMN05444955_10268 [Lihuaxuella thermophila]